MKNIFSRSFGHRQGFSLAEMITTLVIGAMVLVAILNIYSRAERSAAAITRQVESTQIATEVLQLIAEDIDKLIGAGSDVSMRVENKFNSDGYSSARLEIEKSIYDRKNKKQTFERIIWQSNYDFASDVEGLVLYRSHSGMGLEDRLLDDKRAEWELDYSFVPVCEGVTHFRIQIPREEDFLERWTRKSLPSGLVVTVSFAEPFDTSLGTLDVAEEEKVVRTMAVDRTKKAKFRVVPLDMAALLGMETPAEDEQLAQSGEGEEDFETGEGGRTGQDKPKQSLRDKMLQGSGSGGMRQGSGSTRGKSGSGRTRSSSTRRNSASPTSK